MGQQETNTNKGSGSEGIPAVGSSMDDSYHSLSSPITCKSCVTTLAEILNRPDSRPRQLLKAIVNCNKSSKNTMNAEQEFSFEKVKDGIEMQVAMRQQNASTEWKKWREVAAERMSATHNNYSNPNYRGSIPKAASPMPAMATSAVTTDQVVEDLTLRRDSSLDQQPARNIPAAAAAQQQSHTESIKLECRPCDNVGYEAKARALIFGPTPLTIVACTNRLQSQAEVEEILTHELIHAYDLKCSNLNFSDCESMAYSEVRASKAAECSNSWTWRATACIAQNATRAAQNRFPELGRSCVRTVLDQARKDESPLMNKDPSILPKDRKNL